MALKLALAKDAWSLTLQLSSCFGPRLEISKQAVPTSFDVFSLFWYKASLKQRPFQHQEQDESDAFACKTRRPYERLRRIHGEGPMHAKVKSFCSETSYSAGEVVWPGHRLRDTLRNSPNSTREIQRTSKGWPGRPTSSLQPIR